jgi:hypothetical protein
MPFPPRRPQATLDRALFLALAAVVLLAAFAGHDAPAVTKADAAALMPLQAPATVPAAEPAAPVVNLPAGSAELHATAAPASVLAPPAALAAPKKWLPSGKGMWIYLPDKTEGGNVPAIIAKAKATGLTHLWVRMGSAWDGFNVAPFMDKMLPAAHEAGIKVIGWDFPKLDPMGPDIDRARAMINYTTPTGHKIDAGYDAIAPMVYWLDRQPDTDVAGAMQFLSKYNVPIYPVGQAYDGSPEGGRKGVPPPDELWRFMRFAEKHGAAGVSFWSWQAANQPAWNAIREAVEFQAPAAAL